MGSSGHRRITVSLPPDAVDQLDFVSLRLLCSRSALLSELLMQSLPGMVQVAQCMPDPGSDVTTEDIRRLRGASARLIAEQVERLLAGGQDDLFSK